MRERAYIFDPRSFQAILDNMKAVAETIEDRLTVANDAGQDPVAIVAFEMGLWRIQDAHKDLVNFREAFETFGRDIDDPTVELAIINQELDTVRLVLEALGCDLDNFGRPFRYQIPTDGHSGIHPIDMIPGGIYAIPAHGYLPDRGEVQPTEVHKSVTGETAVTGTWKDTAGQECERTVKLDADRNVYRVQ